MVRNKQWDACCRMIQVIWHPPLCTLSMIIWSPVQCYLPKLACRWLNKSEVIVLQFTSRKYTPVHVSNLWTSYFQPGWTYFQGIVRGWIYSNNSGVTRRYTRESHGNIPVCHVEIYPWATWKYTREPHGNTPVCHVEIHPCVTWKYTRESHGNTPVCHMEITCTIHSMLSSCISNHVHTGSVKAIQPR
jgi:hypothetical protein